MAPACLLQRSSAREQRGEAAPSSSQYPSFVVLSHLQRRSERKGHGGVSFLSKRPGGRRAENKGARQGTRARRGRRRQDEPSRDPVTTARERRSEGRGWGAGHDYVACSVLTASCWPPARHSEAGKEHSTTEVGFRLPPLALGLLPCLAAAPWMRRCGSSCVASSGRSVPART